MDLSAMNLLKCPACGNDDMAKMKVEATFNPPVLMLGRVWCLQCDRKFSHERVTKFYIVDRVAP